MIGVELRKKVSKGDKAGVGEGGAQRWEILSGIQIIGWIRRKAIWDGFELEIRQPTQRVWTSGFQQPFEVELGVHEGYVKPSHMKKLGELHHGVQMALSWEWNANCVRLLLGLDTGSH